MEGGAPISQVSDIATLDPLQDARIELWESQASAQSQLQRLSRGDDAGGMVLVQPAAPLRDASCVGLPAGQQQPLFARAYVDDTAAYAGQPAPPAPVVQQLQLYMQLEAAKAAFASPPAPCPDGMAAVAPAAPQPGPPAMMINRARSILPSSPCLPPPKPMHFSPQLLSAHHKSSWMLQQGSASAPPSPRVHPNLPAAGPAPCARNLFVGAFVAPPPGKQPAPPPPPPPPPRPFTQASLMTISEVHSTALPQDTWQLQHAMHDQQHGVPAALPSGMQPAPHGGLHLGMLLQDTTLQHEQPCVSGDATMSCQPVLHAHNDLSSWPGVVPHTTTPGGSPVTTSGRHTGSTFAAERPTTSRMPAHAALPDDFDLTAGVAALLINQSCVPGPAPGSCAWGSPGSSWSAGPSPPGTPGAGATWSSPPGHPSRLPVRTCSSANNHSSMRVGARAPLARRCDSVGGAVSRLRTSSSSGGGGGSGNGSSGGAGSQAATAAPGGTRWLWMDFQDEAAAYCLGGGLEPHKIWFAVGLHRAIRKLVSNNKQRHKLILALHSAQDGHSDGYGDLAAVYHVVRGLHDCLAAAGWATEAGMKLWAGVAELLELMERALLHGPGNDDYEPPAFLLQQHQQQQCHT